MNMARWHWCSVQLPEESGDYRCVRRALKGPNYEDWCTFDAETGRWHNSRGMVISTVMGWYEPEKGPRVMSLDEIGVSCGSGFVEEWFPEDEEGPEQKEIGSCAWCFGGIVKVGRSYSDFEDWKPVYNKPHGVRIWTEMPDKQEQEAAQWDG